MRKLLLYSFVLIALLAVNARATDNRQHIITYLGIEQGLSNNAVRCVFQDHKGFIWFGTYDGLNRYDGSVFKVFRNKYNDSTSLVNNWVFTINEDATHKLWVGTRQGLNVYDHVSGKFSRVRYQAPGTRATEWITAVVRDLKKDASGNMLIGTENLGLLFCPAGSYIAKPVQFIANGQQKIKYDVASIELAANGDVWVMVQGYGLAKLDGRTGSLNLVNAHIQLAACLKAENDHLWIGTPNGLMKYHIPSDQYQDAFTEENGKLPYNKVSGLFLDKYGKLWVATNGGGINVIDTKNNEVVESIAPGNSNYSLTSGSVNAIYEDTEGRKWIGTLRGGINIIDPKKDRFQSVLHEPLNANSLVSNFIFSLCEEPDGTIWVGTDGGGLSRWNRKANQFTNFVHQAGQPGSLSDNFVTNVCCDKDRNIWVSTFWGGVNRYDRHTNSFRHYQFFDKKSETPNNTVYLLYKDNEDALWAGTLGKGALCNGSLYQYDKEKDVFRLFDEKLTDLFAMQDDRSGNLWAGNLRNLIKIDKQHKHHQFFPLGNPIRAIHEDRKGNFWIGTEGGGLVLFDRAGGKVLQRYTTKEGLCNNAVLNILEDEAGDLWISTFYGISRFKIEDRTFTNFYQGDGLSSNQFNYNAALVLKSGEFMFGGIKGLNIFRPSAITASGEKPKMLFTDMLIDNLPLGQRLDYIKKRTDDEIKSIEVPYRNAIFSFDFTALDFSTSNKISYSYYMEGWDKSWNQAGNNSVATYTHLNSGRYIFRVKSTNPEGQWIDNELSLEIIVLPPWYASWWAYLGYMIIVLGIAYIYLVYTKRQRRLKYQVALANMQTEKERELNEKKIAFFTNVSHEFRTPLTLIINPIKDLIARQEFNTNHHPELNIIYRNARRLLRLLDQLLLFRKADSDIDCLKPGRFNFSELCRDVFHAFEQQAQAAGLEYLFTGDDEEIWICGDKEKLEIVLFNLVSNAFKYTPAGGKIVFGLQGSEHNIRVTIEDSGCGIPAASAHRIFEKFFRSEGIEHAQKPGFGIGLYLVKQFTELHKGRVTFESREGKGTVFSITLPPGIEQQTEVAESGPAPAITPLLQEMAEDILPETTTGSPAEEALGALISSKPTMLIVDDDPQIRQYISNMFKTGFNIEEAADGKEGLEKTTAIIPDIVISDIRMQSMSGIELCKAIKTNPALNTIPVILLTGTSSEEIKLESAEVGGDHYITKPFEKEFLQAAVQTALQTRSNLRNYFLNEVTLRKNDSKVSGQYKQFVERCIEIVEANLDNDDFNIKILAREIGMSHSSVYKKIRLVSGESLRGFVRFVRLRKAAELMINTSLNVNEIGFQVGINDVKFFRAQFNKVFGMNPSEYIRRYRKVFEDKYSLEKIETRKRRVKQKPV